MSDSDLMSEDEVKAQLAAARHAQMVSNAGVREEISAAIYNEAVVDATAEAVVDATAEAVVDATAEAVVDATAEAVVDATAEVVADAPVYVPPTPVQVIEPYGRPTVAGEYEAKCMRCSRPMLRADKHCYLCIDCVSAK